MTLPDRLHCCILCLTRPHQYITPGSTERMGTPVGYVSYTTRSVGFEQSLTILSLQEWCRFEAAWWRVAWWADRLSPHQGSVTSLSVAMTAGAAAGFLRNDVARGAGPLPEYKPETWRTRWEYSLEGLYSPAETQRERENETQRQRIGFNPFPCAIYLYLFNDDWTAGLHL